jgi:hypothetical protein
MVLIIAVHLAVAQNKPSFIRDRILLSAEPHHAGLPGAAAHHAVHCLFLELNVHHASGAQKLCEQGGIPSFCICSIAVLQGAMDSWPPPSY